MKEIIYKYSLVEIFEAENGKKVHILKLETLVIVLKTILFPMKSGWIIRFAQELSL